MIMISRLAKKIGQAFSPKKVTKATKKVLPKVTTGGLLIGSRIAANKIMQGMEDKPSIVASTAEDSNLINESYSFNRVEDLTNGLPESYTMGPAHISTYVMVTLLLIEIISLLHLLQEDLQVPDQAERVWQWCGSHSEE